MAYSICSSTPICSFNASSKPKPGMFVAKSALYPFFSAKVFLLVSLVYSHFFFHFVGVFVGNSVPQKAFRINEVFQRTNPSKLLSFEVKVQVLRAFLSHFSSFKCNELVWLWLFCAQSVGTSVDSGSGKHVKVFQFSSKLIFLDKGFKQEHLNVGMEELV